jgi:hypothetical protein
MLIHGNGIPTTVFLEAQTRAVEWLADHPGLVQRSLTIKSGQGA